MNEPKKTKGQRRHANKRARAEAQQQFDKQMGPMPEFLAQPRDDLESNLHTPPRSEQEPIERAPSHMIDASDPSGTYAWNDEAITVLTSRASQERSHEREQKIKELQETYPSIWGKRGAAKQIAISETELDPENPLPERTVQAYFKATKTKTE